MKTNGCALLLVIIFIPALMISCSERPQTQKENRLRYAVGFEIVEKSADRTVIRDAAGSLFTICHTGADKEGAFRSPARRVVSISSPAAPLISALGKTATLIGVKLPEESWHVDAIRRGMRNGSISLIGEGSHEYVNYELIVALKPDLLFTNMPLPGAWPSLFAERNIQAAAVYTHLEKSLLGQFEWIKFIGEFYGEGNLAGRIFSEKECRYNSLKRAIEDRRGTSRILWGSVSLHRASVPGGDSFIANAIEDAGGVYLLREELRNHEGGYVPCNLELFYEKGVNSDVLVLSSTKAGGVASIRDLLKLSAMYGNFRSVKNGNVWRYHPSFWQAIDRPDEVLKDMAALFHPEAFPDHGFRFFEKLRE